jgi:hypothetical protein
MMVMLRVRIDGVGKVTVDSLGTCSSQMPQRGDCSYSVAVGTALTLRAMATQLGSPFKQWTGACSNDNATCTLTPTGATNVTAKFGR